MENNILQKIESLLFIAGKPLTYKKIADAIGGKMKINDVQKAVSELAESFVKDARGVRVVAGETSAQLVTSPEASQLVQNFVKEEMQGELTRPSVETLAIITYRGPVSKLEIERIRGINCSLILRNLMLRGLVESRRDPKKREDYYSVTLEFLKHLGAESVQELPDYAKLHQNEDIDKFLKGEAS